MGLMMGDQATAYALQGLNKQLAGTRDPNIALGLQQQMQGAQQQGAQNMFANANAPHPGWSAEYAQGQREGALANLQRMQGQYGQQMQAMQDARNQPNPLGHLGVPGMLTPGTPGNASLGQMPARDMSLPPGQQNPMAMQQNPLLAALGG